MFESKVKTKSEKELIEITENPSRYAPEFIIAALNEIRNREMNIDTAKAEQVAKREEEKQAELTNNWKVPDDLHSSIKLASNLVFLSVLLGLVNMFFIQTSFSIGTLSANQLPGIIGLGLVAAIGYGIRLGISWVRTLLLVFYIIGALLGFGILTFFLQHAPIAGVIYLLQNLIQLAVIIILFMKPANDWYKAHKCE